MSDRASKPASRRDDSWFTTDEIRAMQDKSAPIPYCGKIPRRSIDGDRIKAVLEDARAYCEGRGSQRAATMLKCLGSGAWRRELFFGAVALTRGTDKETEMQIVRAGDVPPRKGRAGFGFNVDFDPSRSIPPTRRRSAASSASDHGVLDGMPSMLETAAEMPAVVRSSLAPLLRRAEQEDWSPEDLRTQVVEVLDRYVDAKSVLHRLLID